MAIILVVGEENSGYQIAQEMLVAAGLAAANPSKREGMTPLQISEGIKTSFGIDDTNLESVEQLEPGKLWQAMSTDLMLANLSQKDWGWADPNLVHMLEHWRDFDPQVKFVLVYSSPENTIAELTTKNESPTDEIIQKALDSWMVKNSELLSFYHANKDRCMLVNSDTVSKSGSFFVEFGRDQIGADLKDIDPAQFETPPRSAAYDLIAPLLVQESDESSQLFMELESSADLPSPQAVMGDQVSSSKHNMPLKGTRIDPAIHTRSLAMQTLAQFQEMESVLKDKEQEINDARSSNEKLELEAQAIAKELEQQKSDQTALRKELTENQEKSKLDQTQIRSLQTELKEEQDLGKSAQQENENLMLTMHKIQEELDVTFQELMQKREAENNLSAKSKEQSVEMAVLSAKLKELSGEKEKIVQDMGDSSKKHESELKARSAEQDKLLQKIASLSDERQQLDTESVALKGKLGKLETEMGKYKSKADKTDKLEAQLASSSKDSELLLLQLHQVQEELETYFEKYQQSTQIEKPASVIEQPSTDSGTVVQLVDFRQFIMGDNWYYAEDDGRWAGPATRSKVEIEKLDAGRYEVQVEVVDTMAPEILSGLAIAFNGTPLRLNWPGKMAGRLGVFSRFIGSKTQFPVEVTAPVTIEPSNEGIGNTISFDFPFTRSPASGGSDDTRELSLRISSLKVVKL